MSWDASLVADALVNLFGAGGALVVSAELSRADPRGPVTRRIAFALRAIALLFMLRAAAWLTGSAGVSALVDILSAATPLVSLIVAEGLLRRHGPKWLKAAVCAGPLLVALAALIPSFPSGLYNVLLALAVVAGFASVAVLLWQRDRASLTAAENAAIGRVLLALAVLTPLILTDFRSIWPDVPVRLGAAGALLMLYLGLGPGSMHATAGQRLASIAVFAGIGAVFALGYVATGQAPGGDQLMRAAAVGFCGLLFAALFAEAQGARSERGRTVAPLLQSASPAEFRDRLAKHALFGSATILEGAALDHLRHPSIESLLEQRPILRRAAAPWGRDATDEGVERALSLLTAHDASHAMLLTSAPLRVAVLSVPAMSADARVEGEIEIARRIGEFVLSKDAGP